MMEAKCKRETKGQLDKRTLVHASSRQAPPVKKPKAKTRALD